MFAVLGLQLAFGIGPYAAILPLALVFFGLGYALQRCVIGPSSHGEDRNTLLVTLGLSIVLENALLAAFRSDTRSLEGDMGFDVVELGPMLLSRPRLIGCAVALLVALLLWLLLARTDTGRAIRAVARERLGAELVGIDPRHIYAVTFGIGCACLAVAACLLLPSFYVNPRVGNAFVLVAFTIVVLGGMGSVAGALLGGLIVGVVESLGGLLLGDSLGQLGIFLIFILVLLLRPTGLFGARA
jgi:branched-chain amino acid transport system permease protein